MAIGFTPNYVEDLYLEKFTPQQFLVIAVESAKKLEYQIDFISELGFVALTKKSRFKRGAKITFLIDGEKATIKSASTGSEVIDFGSNKRIVRKFTDTFIDFKYFLKSDDIDLKFLELKPSLVPHGEDVLAKIPKTYSEKLGKFFSILIPKEGYFITPILIDLNILVWIIMVCFGVNWIIPKSDDLITWGANFRPLTMEGEWWRLITNCFLHIGIFHLLMNMYALLYIGILLEPRIGKTKFTISYIFTGITASIASLWWHDSTVSAGASGAIFGLYGVFLALLTTNLIEKKTRNALLASIGVFVMYNLLNGAKGNIDNAAHIGGLIVGIILGFSFYLPLTQPDLKIKNLIVYIFSFSVITILSLLFIFYTPNTIAKYQSLMYRFSDTEVKAMSIYKLPHNSSDLKYLSAILDDGLPNWKSCKEIVNKIDSIKELPQEYKNKAVLLNKYCDCRLISFRLMAYDIEKKTSVNLPQINFYNQKIGLIIKKLNGEDISDSLINADPQTMNWTETRPRIETNEKLPKGVLYIVNGRAVDDINNLKPEDIKSMEVLKDNAALQIYGERGKKGVIIIQTK